MGTVTRIELREVACLHREVAMPNARGLLDQCFAMISDALVTGERVEIREFGSFNIGRRGRALVEIPSAPASNMSSRRGALWYFERVAG